MPRRAETEPAPPAASAGPAGAPGAAADAGQPRARRPDPRVAQTRKLVLDATFRLLAEQGLAGATVERVSEYSGVSRSTIYRHWPDPSRLYLEALTPPVQAATPLARVGDLRTDLRTFLRHLVDRLNDPVYAAALAALMAEATRSPQYAAAQQTYLRERTADAVAVVADGLVAGTVRRGVDPEETVYALCAPLVYERLVRQRQVRGARVEEVLSGVLDPLLTRPRRSPAARLRRTG